MPSCIYKSSYTEVNDESFVTVPTILREAVPSTIDNVQSEYDNISSAVYDFTGMLS